MPALGAQSGTLGEYPEGYARCVEAAPLARSVDDDADVGRALGMIMERYDVSARQALDALVRCSERVGVELAEVARILIDLS